MNHPWFRSWSRAQLVLILGALVLGAALRLIENDRPFASSDHAQLAAILTFFQKYNEQFGSWRSMFLIGTRQ